MTRCRSDRFDRCSGFRRLLSFVAVVCGLGSIAQAHDPSESWTNAALKSDSLKVEITMAPQCAMLLLDPSGKQPGGITEENFPDFRARLEALGAQFYVVTSVRTPLKLRSIAARMTEEYDVVFTLVYPPPGAGRLYFHATFLTKLGVGFTGTIYLTDLAGKDLGWDQINAETPNFEATVAATPPAKKTP